MQVAPIPDLDPEINDVRLATANIVNHYVIPNEGKLAQWDDPDRPRSLVERIFIDQEPEAVEEVLQTMANAADLPPAPNAD